MDELKYTYSQLSSDSVGQLVSVNYDLSKIVLHKFYVLGLHDNYLIFSQQKKYILRLYRNDWRSCEEINFELEFLSYLGNNMACIAAPIPTRDNKSSFSVRSPEGERWGVLFPYAEGYAPGNAITVDQSRLLGESVAHVHQLADKFKTNHSRQALDLTYLLDDSVRAIEPFIDNTSFEYLESLQNKIHDAIPFIAKEPGLYGMCVGDVNATNFHINDNNEITIFDFDQCGYGYRAFEIGKFISSINQLKNKAELKQAFLSGYQKFRTLSDKEELAIPYYELVSVIWVMAIHVYNVNRIGYKYLEKPFWDQKLEIVRELERRLSRF